MKRRTLLTACAGLAAGAAGCTGDGGSAPDDGTPTDADPTPTPSPSHAPGVTGTDFAVTNTACGSGEPAAAVDRSDGTVTVDGTATGNNGCYTADLDAARVEDGTLRIAVVTTEDGGTDTACTQCIVDIDYEATVEYQGRIEGVVVTHDGEVVADERY